MSDSEYSKTFKGRVVKRPYALGSKHAQAEAAFLVDASGREFRLRRLGGNPMQDETLLQLVGKRIAGTGRLMKNGNLVELVSWEELPEDAKGS